MTIAIRTLTEADLEPAGAILDAAYGPPLNRQVELRRYLTLQTDGWLLASLDGAPAGMVGAMDYGPFAYVGMMAVHPGVQRRGVGLALMERLMAWLEGRGCPVALLDATEAGAPLYARLGFVEDEKTVVFRRDDCPQRPQPSERVRPLHESDLPALADFDAPIFGARRQAVLASYLADDPGRAFVARDEAGGIAGYLFAQSQKLGPWAAREPAVAEDLLAAALAYGGAPVTLVPSSCAGATRLLMRYGFSPQRSLRHMRRGGGGPPGRRELLYALASFAIG